MSINGTPTGHYGCLDNAPLFAGVEVSRRGSPHLPLYSQLEASRGLVLSAHNPDAIPLFCSAGSWVMYNREENAHCSRLDLASFTFIPFSTSTSLSMPWTLLTAPVSSQSYAPLRAQFRAVSPTVGLVHHNKSNAARSSQRSSCEGMSGERL